MKVDYFAGVGADGTGREFESFVQWVYDTILNLDFDVERVVVGRRVDVRNSIGETHNIDVYYGFSKADLEHKVLIEVKDWQKPVDGDAIAAFARKVQFVRGAIGVVVARGGFQPLARQVAKTSGIALLGPGDFPNLPAMVGRLVTSAALPDAGAIGAPFWVVMETDDNRTGTTGTYFAMKPTRDARKTMPLFVSKAQALAFLETLSERDQYTVRGVSQRQLLTLLRLSTLHGRQAPSIDFQIFLRTDLEDAFAVHPYHVSSLFRDFVRVPVGASIWSETDPPF